MVLGLGKQDDITRLEMLRAPSVCDEVDGLGRAARPDDLVSTAGVDELGDASASGFKRRRSSHAQLMNTAMDIGVVAFVIIHERLNHRARFLRGSSVVEINQRLAVNLLV